MIYQFRCGMCDVVVDVDRAMEDRNDPVECGMCGVVMFRKYSVGAVTVQGLPSDRFKLKDKVINNRQKAWEREQAGDTQVHNKGPNLAKKYMKEQGSKKKWLKGPGPRA